MEWLPTPVFFPGEFHGQRRLEVTETQIQLSDKHFHKREFSSK